MQMTHLFIYLLLYFYLVQSPKGSENTQLVSLLEGTLMDSSWAGSSKAVGLLAQWGGEGRGGESTMEAKQ